MHDLKTLVVGELQTNCYIVSTPSGEGIVIDPGDEEIEILNYIENNKLNIKYIINTHSHPDHIKGDLYIKERTKAPILIHKNDSKMFSTFLGDFFDKYLEDGDIVSVGNLEIKVMHTPGHSKGSICLLLDNTVFTGDTLFADGVGRTDLPGGSHDELIESINNKLLILDDDYKIYPGHGGNSTIGHERKHNPFLS